MKKVCYKVSLCENCQRQSCKITPLRYEIGCHLLLITNRKSHTGFRLMPTPMTLNVLERRDSPYFAFFSIEFDCFAGQLRHKWRRTYIMPVLSPSYRLLLLAITTHPANPYPSSSIAELLVLLCQRKTWVKLKRLTAGVAVDRAAVTLRKSLMVARVQLDGRLPRSVPVVAWRPILAWCGVVGRRRSVQLRQQVVGARVWSSVGDAVMYCSVRCGQQQLRHAETGTRLDTGRLQWALHHDLITGHAVLSVALSTFTDNNQFHHLCLFVYLRRTLSPTLR